MESTRGAHGGYSLARGPSEVTVADLVRCLEGTLPPILCSMPEHRSETCRQDSECTSSQLCCQLENSLMTVLAGTTLADMAEASQTLNTKEGVDVELSQQALVKTTSPTPKAN